LGWTFVAKLIPGKKKKNIYIYIYTHTHIPYNDYAAIMYNSYTEIMYNSWWLCIIPAYDFTYYS
jgi:hypothetical protein